MSSDVEKALEVLSFSKEYRGGFKAVDNISFYINRGECFGLLGPNGAGKSTTINCLIGFYPVSSGKILIMGKDVHASPRIAKKNLGVCSQEETLDSDFNVWDQMVRHASFFGLPRKESLYRTEKLLNDFELFDKRLDLVEALSGGMRRKLQVARALLSNPSLLVLDEPTTGLDPDARRSLWDILIEQRKKGVAVLLSTHYMDEAERLCDRIAVLHQGKILDIETPEQLIKNHVGSKEVQEEVRPGVFWKRAPNLEDVFMKLAGKKLGTNL